MKQLIWLLVSAVGISHLVSCGGSDRTCGPHTTQEGNVCVGLLASSSAASSASSSASSTASSSASTGTGTPPTIEDLLAELPPCKPGSMDGSIDFAAGCIKGACPGDTYDQINAAFGSKGVCMPIGDQVDCGWFNGGVSVILDDKNMDGVPDPSATTLGLFISAPFPGGTKDGLAIGVNMRCFIDSLGKPSYVAYAQLADGSYEPTELQWGDFTLIVDDGAQSFVPPDGTVDNIAIFGGFTP